MWDKITMHIKAQITLCDELISISQAQKLALISSDAAELIKTTGRNEQALHKFLALENSKQTLLSEWKKQAQISENASLMDLARRAGRGARATLQFAERLERRMRELKGLRDQNHALLQNAMQFVEFSVNAMTQTTADDLYAANPQNNSVISKKKIFDQSI